MNWGVGSEKTTSCATFGRSAKFSRADGEPVEPLRGEVGSFLSELITDN